MYVQQERSHMFSKFLHTHHNVFHNNALMNIQLKHQKMVSPVTVNFVSANVYTHVGGRKIKPTIMAGRGPGS